MRAQIRCSCGFVNLPISVRALFLIRAVLSKLGALILLIVPSSSSLICLFPFSSSVYLGAIVITVRRRDYLRWRNYQSTPSNVDWREISSFGLS